MQFVKKAIVVDAAISPKVLKSQCLSAPKILRSSKCTSWYLLAIDKNCALICCDLKKHGIYFGERLSLAEKIAQINI